jgi:syntaxin 18
LRLLGTLRSILGSSNTSEECLTLHHNGIAWFLNRRLAEVSLRQKQLQEERIQLQSRRTHTLGNRATFEAAQIAISQDCAHMATVRTSKTRESISPSLSSSWFSLGIPPETGWSFKPGFVAPGDKHSSITIFDDDAISSNQTDLSPSQIQVFESENSALLKSMESELASVQRAEARLLEISALQSELVFHLSQQAEQTGQLFDDAIASTAMAEKGNVQLREAARRAMDSRVFLLVFLLGSSFALLFLHFY